MAPQPALRTGGSASAAGTVGGVLDPRVARSREAVISAARELLVEGGPSAVTVDAVVARSGVAKSTIYRHWESRDDLLVGVMQACAPNVPSPAPDLEFAEAVRAMVRAVGGMFNDGDWARMLPALMMLKHHEDGLAHLDEELHADQMRVLEDLRQRGVREGRVKPDTAPDEIAAQLIGPLFFALITESIPIDEAFCDRVVDRFLAASDV